MSPREEVLQHAVLCRKALEEGKPRPRYEGAYLSRADLSRADLCWAYLCGADLRGADLSRAELREANLSGATLPCGVKFEDYKKDPLAGLCKEPEARKRAVAAWGNHKWTNCPMHEGLGISRVEEAPENISLNVAAFVALFDAKLLPVPGLR